MAITIAVANQKGGVGKTTTALEVSVALSDMGKRVLLFDLDQQCNLTGYVNADTTAQSIYDVLHVNCRLDEAIQHLSKFDFVPSSPELSKADREFVDQDDVFLLLDLTELCENNYDYIIIDNSPSRNILLTMAYIAADYLLIPTECDDGSITGIEAVHKDLMKLRNGRVQYSHAKILGVILNKYEKTILHSTAQNEIEKLCKSYEDSVLIYTVRKSINASECKRLNMSVQEYDKDSTVAKDFRLVTRSIVRRCEDGK